MAYTQGGQGFVDDGSANMTVNGVLLVTQGINQGANTLAGSGSITVPSAGFFYVPASGSSGAGFFTGSVPSPASYPGSMLCFTDTGVGGSFNWLLSGSAPNNGRALFTRTSGSIGDLAVAQYGGGTIKMPTLGSIIMVSDGYHWCITGGSGSYVLAGNNALYINSIQNDWKGPYWAFRHLSIMTTTV